jgi:hypothetical protein
MRLRGKILRGISPPKSQIFDFSLGLSGKAQAGNLRQTIHESSLPEMLDYSLTRENLLKILYCGEIHAEHESDTPAAQNT